MSNLNAALGYAQIKFFKKILKKKIDIENNYDKAFKLIKKFSIMPRLDTVKSSCWLYSIKLQTKKDALSLIRYLNSKKIESRLFWENLSSQKPYKKYLLLSNKVSNCFRKDCFLTLFN